MASLSFKGHASQLGLLTTLEKSRWNNRGSDGWVDVGALQLDEGETSISNPLHRLPVHVAPHVVTRSLTGLLRLVGGFLSQRLRLETATIWADIDTTGTTIPSH